ncbi:uncharacterized protein [Nicotiana sylvestris]|uniref:uncharacterized protein n=1 Tax=Nicotiana sylvestris TaxID=4096 RepID=UPI00388C4238
MIPKVDASQSFSDIRPISLCNVSSKIIAKVINSRLSRILPRIVTQNQSGFVKGRAITENILLAQEIINGIGKPRKGANVVIKLDMAKAYDRVSWPFLCLYLDNLDSQKNGLILYTDLSLTIGTLFLLMVASKTLAQYEKVSGQLINKSKCCFTMSPGTAQRTTTRVINRIRGWRLKFLSFGGRATLIRHVLLALNIHTLAVVHPPKGTIYMIEKYINSFFWSRTEEGGNNIGFLGTIFASHMKKGEQTSEG